MLLHHRRCAPATVELSSAKRALGLEVDLSGALGRRTKHQEHATSLLVCRIRRAAHAAADAEAAADGAGLSASDEAAEGGIPACVVEEDEELLDAPKLVDGDAGTADAASGGGADGGAGEDGSGRDLAHGRLTPLEQSPPRRVRRHQASRPTTEGVEEMEPYVRASLAAPRSWAAASHALRLKARLEARTSGGGTSR